MTLLDLLALFHPFVPEDLLGHVHPLDLLHPLHQEDPENQKNQLYQVVPLAQASLAYHTNPVHQEHLVVQFVLFLLTFL